MQGSTVNHAGAACATHNRWHGCGGEAGSWSSTHQVVRLGLVGDGLVESAAAAGVSGCQGEGVGESKGWAVPMGVQLV